MDMIIQRGGNDTEALSIGTNNLSSIKYSSKSLPSDVKTLVVKEGL